MHKTKEQKIQELKATIPEMLTQEHLEWFTVMLGGLSKDAKISLLGKPTYYKLRNAVREHWQDIVANLGKTDKDQQLPNGMWLKNRKKEEDIIDLDMTLEECAEALKATLGIDLKGLRR